MNKLNNNKVYRNFIGFVLGVLAILMLFLVNASFYELKINNKYFGIYDIGFIVFTILFILLTIALIKRNTENKKIILIIVFTGLVLRCIYSFSIKSVPVSDFAIMYETAGEVINGNFYEMWSTGYIARFPHLTIPVMYLSVLRYFFGESLYIIKIFNVIASTFNIILIYLIVKELFENRRYALFSALITALFPPLILYTAIFTTENIAIPFFLLSIYFFIKAIKSEYKIKMFIFAGISLSIGNLFRMVGQVILVAFILYIFVSYSSTIRKKTIVLFITIVSFLIPLIGTSYFLHNTGVIEYHLWKGREPALTNVVKGLNIENEGRWNKEDAEIPNIYNFDYDKISEVCKEIIWERLSTTPKPVLFRFFVNKFTSQWTIGDFSGAYWAEHSVDDSDMLFKVSKNGIWYIQLFLCILISLSYVGLFNRNKIKENPNISLIYYIFCGYGLFYLISENQARYGFIVSWIFILMSIVGVDFIINMKGRDNSYGENI